MPPYLSKEEMIDATRSSLVRKNRLRLYGCMWWGRDGLRCMVFTGGLCKRVWYFCINSGRLATTHIRQEWALWSRHASGFLRPMGTSLPPSFNFPTIFSAWRGPAASTKRPKSVLQVVGTSSCWVRHSFIRKCWRTFHGTHGDQLDSAHKHGSTAVGRLAF